jgi:hypothetical protein
MLTTLPSDLGLQILAWLSLSELRAVQLVSRSLHGFVRAHEDSIYRAAALYHRFVNEAHLDLAENPGPIPWQTAHESTAATWKALCAFICACCHDPLLMLSVSGRAGFVLEHGWHGQGEAALGSISLPSLASSVLHVDEAMGTVLIVCLDTRFHLLSLKTGRTLWQEDPVSPLWASIVHSDDAD